MQVRAGVCQATRLYIINVSSVMVALPYLFASQLRGMWDHMWYLCSLILDQLPYFDTLKCGAHSLIFCCCDGSYFAAVSAVCVGSPETC